MPTVTDRSISFVDAPEFHDPDAAAQILAPLPCLKRSTSRRRLSSSISPFIAALFGVELLTPEQETHCFRRMNYLKFLASRSIDSAEISRLLASALEVRNLLVQANLRLVVFIVRRRRRVERCFYESLSDGNLTLIRAVELFDFTEGTKFSTYASAAIRRNVERLGIVDLKVTHRYRTFQTADGLSDVRLVGLADTRSAQDDEAVQRQQRKALVELLEKLPEDDRHIVTARFGLSGQTSTLKQLSQEFGVTGECISQREQRAVRRLRKLAQAIDCPGFG